jgi:hypothetical protein
MVCMFSEYCETPFTIEPVDVVNADGSTVSYPVSQLISSYPPGSPIMDTFETRVT